MLITNFTYNNFCNLLMSILDSSFNISTTKISNIDDFNNYIDIEFRKIIWPDYNHVDKSTMDDLLQMKKNSLCILHSSVEFTTIIFSFVIGQSEISLDIKIG